MRKNNCVFLLLLVFIITVLYSCNTRQKESPWSSMDPLSIPLKIRQEWYKKGNLVLNSSFEQCKISKNDSTVTNFKLSNWTVIGKDVQLTDIAKKKVYDSADAFQGAHAIKIVRTASDVKEIDNRPEGVESDFIKVIPGNYNFYFYTRLKQITRPPYPENRFHKRIGEGIDIRIRFYNKSKKEISPGIYFEYAHKKIDNGFKGFAFSNYFFISNFEWGKVRGQTLQYPFSEGDLPDNCSYVKIFLGLACEGTMWIDSVNFHLSRWNFTPMERMDSFFHKKYDLTELMIPTPKSISDKRLLSLKNKVIRLLYDKKDESGSKPALTLLREKISKVSGDSIRTNTSKSVTSPNELQIILVSNSRQSMLPELVKKFQAIKGKKQGYFIQRKENKIYLGANGPAGWFNAACSLTQLIDYKTDTLDYANITDYPDFTGRSALLFAYQNKRTLEQNKSLSDSAINAKLKLRDKELKQQLKNIDFYAYYKLNDLYDGYFNLSKQWWLPGSFYKKYFSTIGKYCSTKYPNIMHLAVQFNPYFHFGMVQREDTLSDSLRRIFSHGSDESFDKIIGVLKPALEAGARTVMFCADDFVPHRGMNRGVHTLFTKADKRQFTNLAAAQDYLLNKLKAWLDKNYGNVRLEFVPPYYNNLFINYSHGIAQSYYLDLTRHLDSSVVLVWTGKTIRSLSYDMANIHRITKLFDGREPMIWDNSPYARVVESKNGGYPINYPLKSVMCDLFEPFDIAYPPNFPSYLNSHYYSNNSGSGEINKIKNITFADFAWNTKDYNPDFSLFKALVRLYGEKNAKLLLMFNDAYFKFVATWGQLRMDIEHHSDYKLSTDQNQKADVEIKNMKEAYSSLQPIENKSLKKELKSVMDRKIKGWHKLFDKASRNKK